MKKNLNIAYLNGAEGMIRRGGASSGESGGGSNSGDTIKWEYYKVDLEKTSDKELAEMIVLCAHSVNYSVVYQNQTDKFINSPCDLISQANSIHPILSPDGVSVFVKKIAGNNIPIKITVSYGGETNTLTANNDSWIENIKMYCGVYDIPFLIPISEEQFYSLE